MTGMEKLDEAIGKLTAAALQISPKDDQIIADHIRGSVAILLEARHKIRESVSAQDMRNPVSGPTQAIILLRALHDKISTRLNSHLVEMKEGHDDSITGFNEAWTIVSDIFRGTLAKFQPADPANVQNRH